MRVLLEAKKKAETGNVAEQIWAILTFAKLGSRESVPMIQKHLESRDSGVRWAAVYALAELNDRESADLVRPLLRDSSRWVRATSAITFSRLLRNDAVESLLQLLKDHDELVVLYAIYALAEASATNLAIADLSALANDNRRVWESRGETIANAAKYALYCVDTRLTPDVRSVIHSLDIGLRFSDDARSEGSTIKELGSLPIYGQVVSFVNPKNSLRQIAKATNIDEQIISMIAYDLYLRGLVEIVETPSMKRAARTRRDSSTPNPAITANLIEKIKSLDVTSDKEDEENFDSMTPEELMSWMETLAARQGAIDSFTTEPSMNITEVDPNAIQTEDVDAIAWLESLAADTDPEEPDVDDEAIEAQIPDWLQEQDDYEASTEDMPDWLSSTDVDTMDIPDWFMESVDEDPSTDIFAEPISSTAIALFTAYIPSEVTAKIRHNLFVYAHTEQYRPDIEQDASKRKDELGGTVPKPKRAKKTAALEIGTSITIIPECNELEFEPESLTKKWHGDWSRFGFEFRPTEDTIDETLFLRISIQVAGIEIAHIKSAIEVVEAEKLASTRQLSVSNPLLDHKMRSQTVTPYQRIFISYSRRDSTVAKSYKIAQTALGNDAFLDVDNLRAGEDWRAALARAIDEADIFQLFWSEHSASSEYCRYEWDYAMKVRCPEDNYEGFIRPVYWRKPMPSPPPELSRINFRFVPFKDQDD